LKSKIETNLIEHFLQILNMHLRGEIPSTSKAHGARALLAGILI